MCENIIKLCSNDSRDNDNTTITKNDGDKRHTEEMENEQSEYIAKENKKDDLSIYNRDEENNDGDEENNGNKLSAQWKKLITKRKEI